MISSYSKHLIEAGCDEAGRGCLAGPVFAAAVVLPPDFYHPALNDSKKVKEKERLILRDYIHIHALDYSVQHVSEQEIDRINILNASIKAMHKAIKKLSLVPELLLIDGNQFKPFGNIPHHCLIQGDSHYASIAAASILAKTYRDEYMTRLSHRFPQYAWADNKGYGTLAHRHALNVHGATRYHRRSFKVKPLSSKEL